MTELHAVEQAANTQSWDDFWDEVAPQQRTEIICGVEVLVPTDMPLAMTARLEQLQDSESEDDLRELVEMLFGEGAMADWEAAGMTVRQFQVVLAWGIAHASGQDISFGEAHARVTAAEQGKAPANRAARRAAARPRSASTGTSSSRTSAASTASRRKTSRG